MNKYPMVKLEDIAIISAGQSAPQGNNNYSNNGIPFVKAGDLYNLVNGLDEYKIQKVSNNVAEKFKLKLYPSSTILFAKSGMSCNKGYIYSLKNDCYVVNHLACITINSNNTYYKFLEYYLMFDKPNKLIKDISYPSISLNDISKMTIPLPPIEEQRHIANVLDKVTTQIDNCKKILQNLDVLVKSKFMQMFGDPVLNNKNFPLLKVDDVIEFQGGNQPDKKYFEYKKTNDNIRLIQIRDYKTDKYITYIPKSKAKRFCNADDIMIGRYGPPIFQILKGLSGAYNVALMKAIPKRNDSNKEFIRNFLKQDCLLHYLEGLSQRTAGQDGIEMPKLKEYPFPYPPIELQNQFAEFVENVEKQKTTTQNTLNQLETLKNALMQEYFS